MRLNSTLGGKIHKRFRWLSAWRNGGLEMLQATIKRALIAVAFAGFSTPVLSEAIYLSCVYEVGPPFAVGSPITFVFDESRKEILLGDGSPARSAVIAPTEISFLHLGPLHSGSVPISIDRISGRFRTTVSTMGGNVPANGSCTLTKKRQF